MSPAPLDMVSLMAKMSAATKPVAVTATVLDTSIISIQSTATPTAPISINAPLSEIDQIKQTIAELHTKLQTAAPGYESLLFQIHKVLKEHEENTTLLTEEEIGVISAALTKRKNIVIATATARSGKNAAGKKATELGLGDL